MKLLIKNILILIIKKLILYSRIYKFIPIYLLVFFDIFPRDLFGLFLSYKKIMKKNNLYNFENIMTLALIQVIGQFCLNFYIEIVIFF